MEKEIKIRKKRFAAFWAMVLLVCSLAVPAVADETPSESSVLTNENVDSAEAIFYSGGETYFDISNLNGSIVSAGTEIGYGPEFEVQYYDYDGSKLSGAEFISYGETHTVSAYSGNAPASCFDGWKLAVVEVSGETARANLTAQVNPYPITSGEHTLTSGNTYILHGVTKVAGDPSTYVSGSIVYGDGTYHFS